MKPHIRKDRGMWVCVHNRRAAGPPYWLYGYGHTPQAAYARYQMFMRNAPTKLVRSL